MGYFSRKRKRFLALAIVLSLQLQAALPCYSAAQVIDIAAANGSGVSHNRMDSFNVGADGAVFNNIARGTAKSELAGSLNANNNLQGTAARLILTEVTGAGTTNLNGMLEIAGTKADLVIANPNGIIGRGFAFINVGRAVLTTGAPAFGADGALQCFAVAGGKVDIQNAGYEYNSKGYMPDKLDIYARAIAINDELYAQDEINLIAGSSDIRYKADGTLAVQKTAAEGERPQALLDVAALGGMYAGKIMLVGTEKGLGMNIGGNLKAQKDLSITGDGRVVFQKNSRGALNAAESESTSITSDGNISVKAEKFVNDGAAAAKGNLTLDIDGKLVNSGILEAGSAYTENEEEENPVFLHNDAELKVTAKEITNSGILSASKTLDVTSFTTITNDGDMYSDGEAAIKAGGVISGAGSLGAGSSITAEADKITLNRKNIYTRAADGKIDNTNGVVIKEANPDIPAAPPAPGEAEEKFSSVKLPEVTKTGEIAATESKAKAADEELDLAANNRADGKYKPIIDKAANGVDLVQIAEVDGNGVSRNLYSDFNIKSTGLILNNATKYSSTELGGYVDRNMRLAGRGARVILNEVTSSRASTLNGYLEVAGNKASVVIANANGLSINGLGFINTDSVIISAGAVQGLAGGNVKFAEGRGDINIAGDGLNARSSRQLDLVANNIYNVRSELYGREIHISADGLLQNTGKITADNNVLIKAGAAENKENALLAAGENLQIDAQTSITNDKSIIQAAKDAVVKAENFTNRNAALFSYAQNGTFTIGRGFVNNNAVINADSADGVTKISAENFRNENKGAVVTNGSLEAYTKQAFTNKGEGNIFVKHGFISSSEGDFLNEDALLALGASGTITAKNITNKNADGVKQGALINAVGDLSLTAKDTVLNRSSDIESEGSIAVRAKNLVNKKELFITSFKETHEDISYKIPHLNAPNYYDAVRRFDRKILTAQIDKETADANIIAGGNISIDLENNLSNHYSKIKAGKDLTVNAGGTVENIGYQGTIHYYDTGNDYHYWKYKKHRRFHIGCHWVYGTTVIPYYDHTMRDEEKAEGSERLSLLSANGGVQINAGSLVNKTHQAEGKAGGLPESSDYFKTDETNHLLESTEYKEKQEVSTAVSGKSTAGEFLDISSLQINGKIYKLTEAASAKYLIETDKRFADYHEFLSSDYLLERVKADPEKVGKRLGDGYFEQQLVLQQIGTLTGRKYLGDYGSDMEQFAALMKAGATAAEELGLKVGVKLTAEQVASLTADIVWLVEEEVNGQRVLVPEVFLAQVRSEDLRPGGALIVGGEVELYSKQDIKNMGSIKSDGTVALRSENAVNRGEIAGESLNIKAEKNITNSGTMRAKADALLQAENITNEAIASEKQYRELNQKKIEKTGSISAGQNLTLEAGSKLTNKGAKLSAGKNLTLNANDIDIVTVAKEKHVAVAYGSSSAEIHDVQHQQSALSGENIRLNAKKDISIAGGILSAANNVDLNAEGGVSLTAVKDLYSEESEVGSRGGSYYNHNKQADEAVRGTTIAAKNDVGITSGNDIKIKGSNVTSEAGKVSLAAENNINIANETEKHERLHELHSKVSGVLSSKTTDIYDYSRQDAVVGSNISANEASLSSRKDTNITGSTVIADNNVSIKAGGDLNISSAEQTSESLYIKQVKKSGLLSGGGIGFTIGKEKQKDQYANRNVEQVGSTVGSISGNVNLTAEKEAKVKGSTVVAGRDISITGAGVAIENSDSIYNAQEKHEFERTGISVSVGGDIIDAANAVVQPLEKAAKAQDKRLAALEVVKAGKEAQKYLDAKDNIAHLEQEAANAGKLLDAAKADNAAGGVIKNLEANKALQDARLENAKNKKNGGSNDFNISVSVGTTKSRSESSSTTTVAKASEIKAGGDVSIVAAKKDISITGSSVSGENVKLDARENLNISASKNTNKTEESSKSSSVSIGATISSAGTSYNVSGSMSRGEVSANGTTYNESTVTANKDLSFASGRDTNIKGSMLKGEKVTGSVGNDLNIESKQDSNSYKESSKSAGVSIGIGSGSVSGGVNSSKIKSNYESVTDQSGIYAGSEGFDIGVGKNTDLKGGIISGKAEAEKNTISTGTLTFEDIENKAEYKASSAGANANIKNGADYNEQGVTPAVGMPASGKEESKTKATISEGTIEIRDKENQKQDVNKLNRDTNNSLNKLGEIFDKNTVKEKQEFAGLFQEFAHNYIGELTGKVSKDEKAILNSFVDGLISQWTNGNFIAGAGGTALLESMQKEIDKIKDPALKQIAAGMVGAIAGKIVGDNAQTGASSAISTEKYNWLAHEEQEKLVLKLESAKTHEERVTIIEEALALSELNREKDPKRAEYMEKFLMDELEKITKYDDGVGISFKVNTDLGLHNNLEAMKEFFVEYNTFKYLPEIFKETIKLEATLLSGGVYAGANNINKIMTYGDLGITFVSNLTDSRGVNKNFISKMGYEEGKTIALSAIDKYTGKSNYVGIIAIGKATTSVYLDINYKDILTSKITNKIDEILDAFVQNNVNENYMGD